MEILRTIRYGFSGIYGIPAQLEIVFFGYIFWFGGLGNGFGRHNDDDAGELFHFGYFSVIDFLHQFTIRSDLYGRQLCA